MIYTTLDTDDKIISAVNEWNGRPLSVDFEGEFNLHIYGEHLCLVQIFDGDRYYIIDARSRGVTAKGLEAFFSSSSEKVWFDIQSDASLVYKKYGLRISNVFDIRVPALLLGYNGNLLGLIETYLGKEINIDKKKNQQANWLERPLDITLIDYALTDVMYLFALKKVLLEEIEKKNLTSEMLSGLKRVTQVKEPTPGWRHIGYWRKMNRSTKENLKTFFIARDTIAKRFNVPAARVMDKHTLLSLAENPPQTRTELRERIKNEPQRFRTLLEESLWKEMEKSRSVK